MSDDVEFNLADLDAHVCPIDAASGAAIWQDPEALASGRAALAALTGRFLPPDNADPPMTRGVTAITAGGGTPIEVTDKTGRAANLGFGAAGEVDAAFDYGQRGYRVLTGPSGAAGKATNSKGIDLLAFHPEKLDLRITDNKQSTVGAPVRSCTALNENLLVNLADQIEQVSGLDPFPEQQAILDKLRTTESVFRNGGRLPPGVGLYITNGGGNVPGISKDLDDDFAARYKGVLDANGDPVRLQFDNMRPPERVQQAVENTEATIARANQPLAYQPLAAPITALRPDPVSDARATTGAAVVAAGMAAPVLVGLIQDGLRIAGVKDALQRSADDKLNTLVRTVVVPHLQNAPDDGALVVVNIQTTEPPTFDGPSSSEVSGYGVSFGKSAADAYVGYLDQARNSLLVQTPYLTSQHWVYWYHKGTIEPYHPAQDPRLQPAAK